jgi:hypothetical protein
VHESLPAKPEDVVDRDRERGPLTEFVTDPDPAMRLGIVPGRRRHGKSYPLQALSERVGGLYVTAGGRKGGCRRSGGSVTPSRPTRVCGPARCG